MIFASRPGNPVLFRERATVVVRTDRSPDNGPKQVMTALVLAAVVYFFLMVVYPWLGLLISLYYSPISTLKLQFYSLAFRTACFVSLYYGIKRLEKWLLVPFFAWLCLCCAVFATASVCVVAVPYSKNSIVYHGVKELLMSDKVFKPASTLERNLLVALLALSSSLYAVMAYIVYKAFYVLADYEKRPPLEQIQLRSSFY